jgi:putative acetyltransferase
MMIKVDDLRGPEIAKLLQDHLEGMRALSPPDSVHALDLDALRRPEITFWTAWDNGVLLGCGAIKQLDAAHAEVKSMRTAAGHLRKGVAAHVLARIVEVAQQRGYRRLSLETGSMKGFAPAHALYAGFGFEFCGPFADYTEDPHSVFMTKELA